jgi:hypothetical protein
VELAVLLELLVQQVRLLVEVLPRYLERRRQNQQRFQD